MPDTLPRLLRAFRRLSVLGSCAWEEERAQQMTYGHGSDGYTVEGGRRPAVVLGLAAPAHGAPAPPAWALDVADGGPCLRRETGGSPPWSCAHPCNTELLTRASVLRSAPLSFHA